MTEQYDDGLLEGFRQDALDHLADIEDHLAGLHDGADPDLVDTIFRAAHSLKGSAGFLDLHAIQALAHRTESLLDAVRQGRLVPDDAVVDILYESFDQLTDMVEHVTEADRQSADDLPRRLEAIVDGEEEPAPAAPTPPAATDAFAPRLFAPEPAPITADPSAAEADPFDPYLTAGDVALAQGRDRVLDLSCNANPAGPSPAAQRAIADTSPLLARLRPRPEPALLTALSGHLDTAVEHLAVGPNRVAVMAALLRLQGTRGGQRAMGYAACLGYHRAACALAKVELEELPRDDDLRPPLEQMFATAGPEFGMFFLVNPDDPTGHALTAEELALLAGHIPDGALLVVDESAVDFAWPPEDYSLLPMLSMCPNVVLVRCLAQSHGLSALPLACAIAQEDIAAPLRAMLDAAPPSPMSVRAAMAALGDETHYLGGLDMVLRVRPHLEAGLAERGCEVIESCGGAVCFAPPGDAREVYLALFERGVLVRQLTDLGLDDRLRVSVGTDAENAAFLHHLDAVLG